jgi:hypothetical protein
VEQHCRTPAGGSREDEGPGLGLGRMAQQPVLGTRRRLICQPKWSSMGPTWACNRYDLFTAVRWQDDP